VGVGPYIAIGISGNASGIESTVYPNDPAQNTQMRLDEKVNFGSEGYRRFQFGANAVAGIRVKNRWIFNISYDLGLTSLNHDNLGYLNIKDNQFTLSVGYYFK
jgi:hypothetical protein